MKRQVFKKTWPDSLRTMIVPTLCVVIALTITIHGLGQAGRANRAEGLRALEENLKRAVITCYSIEGRYPASLPHIEKNYGVYIDRTKYVVFYEIFASNIMPDIVVLQVQE